VWPFILAALYEPAPRYWKLKQATSFANNCVHRDTVFTLFADSAFNLNADFTAYVFNYHIGIDFIFE